MTSREMIDIIDISDAELIDPQIDDNALTVLKARYLLKDEDGNTIETPKDMFLRVAESVANAEDGHYYFINTAQYPSFGDVAAIHRDKRNAYDKHIKFKDNTIATFYNLMASLDFLPNSPTLINAGRELGMLSACFLLELEDSMDSIFQCVKDAALIQKAGGGVGYVFSNLRPKNSVVHTTMGKSSGPVSFMSVFDAMTDTVKQGGVRRGANMGMLSCDHADIEEFIMCKSDNKSFQNFNISVAATDEFMSNVVVNGENKLFDLICEQAWKTGDPGLFFVDKANKDNPIPSDLYKGTNPCGEQMLTKFESCNLGSINLSNMVDDSGNLLEDKLERTVRLAVRFLDNVIDVNKYPLSEIEEKTKQTRKIGLGVMGFADMCIKKGIVYGSDECVELAEEVMGEIDDIANDESANLGTERGTFPLFDKSIYNQPYFYENVLAMRNATCTTIAPTGTLSIIANCSSGIEPIFAKEYTRNTLDNTILTVKHPLLEAGYDEDLFVEAHDIPYEQHIKVQAAFQKYTDNAVSKTINMKSDATVDDVKRAYILAWGLGCKGITIFRDGCKGEQVLEHKKEEAVESIVNNDKVIVESAPEHYMPTKSNGYIHPRKRSDFTNGTTEKIPTGCGNMYVTINKDENGLCETFANMGKSGACTLSQVEAISRLVSLGLRCNVDPKDIIKQLSGIRCPNPTWSNGVSILSCADAISKILDKHVNDVKRLEEHEGVNEETREEVDKGQNSSQISGQVGGQMAGTCPECGGVLMHGEGCVTCRSCGYSKC